MNMEKKEELILEIKKVLMSVKILHTLIKKPTDTLSLGRTLVIDGMEVVEVDFNNAMVRSGEIIVPLESLTVYGLQKLLSALKDRCKEIEIKVTVNKGGRS